MGHSFCFAFFLFLFSFKPAVLILCYAIHLLPICGVHRCFLEPALPKCLNVTTQTKHRNGPDKVCTIFTTTRVYKKLFSCAKAKMRSI